MTATVPTTTASAPSSGRATDHLWMHFTRMSSYDHADVPVIERGEGAYIWDSKGKKYLDALPLSAEDRYKLFEGNARKVYPRIAKKIDKNS